MKKDNKTFLTIVFNAKSAKKTEKENNNDNDNNNNNNNNIVIINDILHEDIDTYLSRF